MIFYEVTIMLKKCVTFIAAGIVAASCMAFTVSAAGNETVPAAVYASESLNKTASEGQITIKLSADAEYFSLPAFTLLCGDTVIGAKKLDGLAGGANSWTFKKLDTDSSYKLKVTVPSGYLINGKSESFTQSVSVGSTYSFTFKKQETPETEPPTEEETTTKPQATEPKPTSPPVTDSPEDKTEPSKEEDTKPAEEDKGSDTDKNESTETTESSESGNSNQQSDSDKNTSDKNSSNKNNSDKNSTNKNNSNKNDSDKKDDGKKEDSADTGVQPPFVALGALGVCAVIAGACVIGKKKNK